MGYRMIAGDRDRWHGYLANVSPSEFERDYIARLPEEISGEEFLARYSGTADSVTITLHDAAGDPVRTLELSGSPAIVDDGTGPRFAYEAAWDTSRVGSGVYTFAVTARKAGAADLKTTGKAAVIR